MTFVLRILIAVAIGAGCWYIALLTQKLIAKNRGLAPAKPTCSWAYLSVSILYMVAVLSIISSPAIIAYITLSFLILEIIAMSDQNYRRIPLSTLIILVFLKIFLLFVPKIHGVQPALVENLIRSILGMTLSLLVFSLPRYFYSIKAAIQNRAKKNEASENITPYVFGIGDLLLVGVTGFALYLKGALAAIILFGLFSLFFLITQLFQGKAVQNMLMPMGTALAPAYAIIMLLEFSRYAYLIV